MLKEIYATSINSIISVGTLFILGRLMGKKQIAQLTLFDYIIGISIGSIAAQSAVDPDICYVQAVSAMVVFTLFSIALSFISRKSYVARKLLDGTPVVLIEKGIIIEKGLKKTKLTVNDLLEECRQKDVFDVAEIEFAILETSGKLSVLPKSEAKPLTPRDMKIETNYEGLCVNLIIDGKVMRDHLQGIKCDEKWLNSELNKSNIKNISDVLLCYADSSGNIYTHIKNAQNQTERTNGL